MTTVHQLTPNSTWKHIEHKNLYRVIVVTNLTATTNSDFIPQVVYQDIDSNEVYSRSVDSFIERMDRVILDDYQVVGNNPPPQGVMVDVDDFAQMTMWLERLRDRMAGTSHHDKYVMELKGVLSRCKVK